MWKKKVRDISFNNFFLGNDGLNKLYSENWGKSNEFDTMQK